MKRKAAAGDQRGFKKPRLQRQPSIVLQDVVMADRFQGVRRKPQAGLAPELKFNDVSFVTDATTTGAVISLNNFAAGDTASTRDGNKILQKSIHLKYTCELESLAQNAVCRFIIVYDGQPNLAAPSIATAGTGPLDAITPTAMRQIATVSRFHVLSDNTFEINSQSDTAGALAIRYFETYIKIPEKYQAVTFGSSGATEPVTGGLYLMYLSTVAAGATDVNVVGSARLRFIG